MTTAWIPRATASELISATSVVDMVHDARRNLLYISAGGRILRYDLGLKGFLQPFEIGGTLQHLDLSADGKYIAVGDAGSASQSSAWIYIINTETGEFEKATLIGASGVASDVAWGFDGSIVIALGNYANPIRYDPASKTSVAFGSFDYFTLSPSADRKFIGMFGTSGQGSVNIFDVAARAVSATFTTGDYGNNASLNRDATQSAIVSGFINIYDAGFNKLATLGERYTQNWTAYHPRADALIVLNEQSEIITYDTVSLQEIGRVKLSESRTTFPRLRLAGDGSLVFVTTLTGVSWFTNTAPVLTYSRLMINGSPERIGAPSPDRYGTNYVIENLLVTNTVPAVADFRGVRYWPTGATVSIPSERSSSNEVVLQMTTNATIQWNWRAVAYQLEARPLAGGAIDITNQFVNVGESATVTAAPIEGYSFLRWTGDIPPNLATVNPLNIAMDKPRQIFAMFGGPGATSLQGDWPTYAGSPEHLGYFRGALGTNRFNLRWSLTNDTELQLAVAGGRVYATPYTYFGTAIVSAYSEASGAVVWRKDFSPNPFSMNPPTYADGAIYFQKGNATYDRAMLFKLNADSGDVIWTAPFGAQWERYFAPAVADGKVWVDAGAYGGMSGYYAATGTELFSIGLEQYDQWTPTWSNGRLFSYVAGKFREHNPLTGEILWIVEIPWQWSGWSSGRVCAVKDDFAYVTSNPGLCAIDVSQRKIAWKNSGAYVGTPVIANGVVYAMNSTNGVGRFAAETGAALGTVPCTVDGKPFIVADDFMVVGSVGETAIVGLYPVQRLQTIPVGGTPTLANGILYISNPTGLQAWSSGLDRKLTISASGPALGAPAPFGYGANKVFNGTRITNTVPAFAEAAGVRYKLTGTSVTGCENSGTDSSVVLSLTNDVSVMYTWQAADYRLNAFTYGRGEISGAKGWHPIGATAEVTATPATGFKFLRWSGDIPRADASSPTIQLLMDRSRTVTAIFVEEGSGVDPAIEWATLGKNSMHDGHVPDVLGTNQFHYRWSVNIGGTAQRVAVGNHRVFMIPAVRFGNAQGLAYGAYSGSLLWTQTFPTPNSMSPPTFDDGSVFLQRNNHTSDSFVYRLDEVTGNIQWKSPYSEQWETHPPPAVGAGRVYVAGGDGQFFGYREETGTGLFAVNVPFRAPWIPSIMDNRLFSFTAGIFREHNLDTADSLWNVVVGGAESAYNVAHPPVLAEGKAFLVNNRTALIAIDLATQQISWQSAGQYIATPVVANGILYTCEAGRIVLFAADTGFRVGEIQMDANTWPASDGFLPNPQLLALDDKIILSGAQTYIYDLTTRAKTQTIPAGGYISYADGVLYIADSTGNLQAYSSRPEVLLAVRSTSGVFGRAFPFTFGSNFVPKGESIEATILPFEPTQAGLRVTANGWTGTGDAPATGEGGVARFVINKDSEITWTAATQALVRVTINGRGSVNSPSNWFNLGTTAALEATPDTYADFSGWTGDVTNAASTIALRIDSPMQLTANFTPKLGPHGTELGWLADYGITPDGAGELADNDGDGLENRVEFILRTNPLKKDTDGDGYDDGLEVAWNSDPLANQSIPRAAVMISSNGYEGPLANGIVYGTNYFALFTTNSISMLSSSQSGVRRTPAGWTATGLTPGNGTGDTLTFFAETNGAVQLRWGTEYAVSFRTNFVSLGLPRDGQAAGRLNIANLRADTLFGYSISAKDGRVAVGTPFAMNKANTARTGAVFLFEKQPDGSWAEVTLPELPAAAYTQIGRSVAVDRDYLVFSGSINGSVFLFFYRWSSVNGWAYENGLYLGALSSLDPLPIAIGPYHFVVGAPDEADGTTRIIQKGSYFTSRIFLEGLAVPSSFGYSIEFRADGLLAIGDPTALNTAGLQTGVVYLYQLTATEGPKQLARFAPDRLPPQSRFGNSVSLSGDYLAVGAPNDGGGSVRLYRLSADNQLQLEQVIRGPQQLTAQFGATVALADENLFVGAPDEQVGATWSGNVHAYAKASTGWIAIGDLKTPEPVSGGSFGQNISISGNSVFVGAPFEGDDYEGRAHVYDIQRFTATSSEYLWAPENSLAPITAAPDRILSGAQLFGFAGWEQSGLTVTNASGVAVNPPVNIPVTSPLDFVVRYTTSPADAIAGLNITPVPNDNKIFIEFEARAGWSFRLESAASLSDPWQLHSDFGSSNVSRNLQITEAMPASGMKFYRLVVSP